MLKADLPDFAKKTLKHLLNAHGEVIYSSHETIRPGPLYLLGLNPGGDGFITIGEHIDGMLSRTTNAFIDDRFSSGNRWIPAGEAPLQKRVRWLLTNLGLRPEEVCSSNLIFKTSRSSDGVSFGLAGICWPFHEAMIDIIRPKILLVFGNGETSPYGFLKELFFQGEEERFVVSTGMRPCKGFGVTINGHPMFVAGLPHLSRFNPIGKTQIIDWLKIRMSSQPLEKSTVVEERITRRKPFD